MITKIIACSDIHIPNYQGIDELKTILTTFINQCKEIVEKEEKDGVRIVVAGDLFNQKINISNESQLLAYWFLDELGKITKTIVIAGNHDMLMNNIERVDSITPLFEINKMKNVIYLDKQLKYKSDCFKDDNVVWCLYSSFEGFNPPDIEAAKTKYGDDNIYIGLIHGDVNGAITATNRVTENGVDPNVFENCDFVIAGHIHKKQEIKKNGVKIVYCSSINQKNFGESITEHGFVLWDISDKDDVIYEYIDVPNPDGGYYKFVINNIDDIENDNEELINL